MADHMIRNQIEPELIAQQMRGEGYDVETSFVNTNPEAQGYRVTCSGCGRVATLPTPIPEGRAALCPNCIRET